MAVSLDVEQKVMAACKKFWVYHMIRRKQTSAMGSIYVIVAVSGIPGERSNHVLGVEEAERGGYCSRQLKYFFLLG